MRCPECGQNFPDAALLCPSCGLSYDEAVELLWERQEDLFAAHGEEEIIETF